MRATGEAGLMGCDSSGSGGHRELAHSARTRECTVGTEEWVNAYKSGGEKYERGRNERAGDMAALTQEKEMQRTMKNEKAELSR